MNNLIKVLNDNGFETKIACGSFIEATVKHDTGHEFWFAIKLDNKYLLVNHAQYNMINLMSADEILKAHDKLNFIRSNRDFYFFYNEQSLMNSLYNRREKLNYKLEKV